MQNVFWWKRFYYIMQNTCCWSGVAYISLYRRTNEYQLLPEVFYDYFFSFLIIKNHLFQITIEFPNISSHGKCMAQIDRKTCIFTWLSSKTSVSICDHGTESSNHILPTPVNVSSSIIRLLVWKIRSYYCLQLCFSIFLYWCAISTKGDL